MGATLSNLDLTGTGYCASLNFRRTARAVTRMYDMAMQASGVRSTQFAILIGVAKTQPVSMGTLADTLGVDRTTLTRSVRLLQKEGMLTRSKRSAMRQRFLQLTPAGEKALKRSLPLWREAHALFVSTVGADYWLKLRAELEGLAQTTLKIVPAADSANTSAPARQ
ncbi:MAG TPA: MarR family winged helix-turn-helix transcriptional regulator [Candidatus Acidoferrum sp.]